MEKELLVGLLNGQIDALELRATIQHEVSRHFSLLKKKGASSPIFLTSKDGGIEVLDLERMKHLKDACTRLDPHTRSYLLDALVLSEMFEFSSEQDEDWCIEQAEVDP